MTKPWYQKVGQGLDVFGINDPDAPDNSQYEAQNDEILKQLEGQIPQKYEELDPETLAKLGPSAMESVSTDPALKAAQMAALKRMSEVADKGYTAEEEAAMNRIHRENAQADRGRREAILADRAARGMGGSGDELAASLSSSQAANEQENQGGLDVAANAQRRALAAMAQSGQMAGQMRGQEFGEKSDIARAKDAVNQFNTNNSVRAQFGNNAGVNNFNQNQFENRMGVGRLRYDSNVNKGNTKTANWNADLDRRNATRGQIISGGSKVAAAAMAHGGKVDGVEVVHGDSELNDIVPKVLSAGEIVIPKTIASDPEKAKKFVAAHNATDDEDLIALILKDIERK